MLAHDGEARTSATRYRSLRDEDQDNVVEFLNSLQVLPPGTPHRIVDEHLRPRAWPE